MTLGPVRDTEPHLPMSAGNVAVLYLKGLRSDRRERRTTTAVADRAAPPWALLDPRIHDPVFVVGAPRSGTSFLGSCLGRMPGMSYHFEPRLTKALVSQLYTGRWSSRRAAAVFRLNYASLLLAAGHGGRRLVDKTPENAFVVPFLARTFPDARFVHIVRDGRDVAVSHAEQPWLAAESAQLDRRGRGGARWGPAPRFWVEPAGRQQFATVTNLERSAWAWRRFTTAAREHLAALPAERAFEIRYEALVARPQETADALAAFLDSSVAAREELRAAVADVRPSSVGRWRTSLTPEDRSRVEVQCGPLLAELGYV